MRRKLLSLVRWRVVLVAAALGLTLSGVIVVRRAMERSEIEGEIHARRQIAVQRLGEALAREGDQKSLQALAELTPIQEMVHGGEWSDYLLERILQIAGDIQLNRIVRSRALATLYQPTVENRLTPAQREAVIQVARVTLTDQNWIIRFYSCNLAARLQDRPALPILQKLTTDEREDVRRAAGKAIDLLKTG